MHQTRPCQLQLAAQQRVMMVSMLYNAMHLVLQHYVPSSTTLIMIYPRHLLGLRSTGSTDHGQLSYL